MHESIPVDSLLATRLESRYYTTFPTSPFPVRERWVWKGAAVFANPPSKEETDWRKAQTTRLSDEFRTDLIAALGLQRHHACLALVLAAEQTAKEWASLYEEADSYDCVNSHPSSNDELRYTARVAARFAVFLA